MPRIFWSEAGDKCDSEYECLIINDLIDRGVDYEFHPGPFTYLRKLRKGKCLSCEEDKEVYRVCTYVPDLYLPSSDIYIELKGGSMTQASRGRLVDFVKYGEIPLHFLFRDNRPIYSGSKTKHLHWARRMGCVAETGLSIPEEWL